MPSQISHSLYGNHIHIHTVASLESCDLCEDRKNRQRKKKILPRHPYIAPSLTPSLLFPLSGFTWILYSIFAYLWWTPIAEMQYLLPVNNLPGSISQHWGWNTNKARQREREIKRISVILFQHHNMKVRKPREVHIRSAQYLASLSCSRRCRLCGVSVNEGGKKSLYMLCMP